MAEALEHMKKLRSEGYIPNMTRRHNVWLSAQVIADAPADLDGTHFWPVLYKVTWIN